MQQAGATSPFWLVGDLLTRVDAYFNPGTNVLIVKYKSNSAIEGAQVANAFLSAFINAAIEMKIDAAQQTAQWLEPRTEQLRAEAASARENLVKFQHKSQLLAPDLVATARAIRCSRSLNSWQTPEASFWKLKVIWRQPAALGKE